MISESELKWLLNESLARHRVPGASVAVMRVGEFTAASAGVVNVNTGVEITPETVMHIGSITKVFNATLVMQLVDEGKIELDESVLHYLPHLELKDREALGQITVRMLLNHTSGIDGEMLPDYGHDDETIEKGIARFGRLGQLFSPGSEFSYCNVAMVIAGYLAQRLTGKSWYQLVRERIFETLRMEHAAALPEEALLHRASVGHYINPANQKVERTPVAFLPLSFSPAGTSLMMSAVDLIAFASAHMRNGVAANGARILSEHSAKAMQQITVNNKGKGYTYMDMGLGWLVSDDGLLFHAGGGLGVFAALYVHPNREFAAAILTNAAHGLGLVNEFMGPWLKEVGAAKPFGVADIHLPPDRMKLDLSKYVGIYEDVLERYHVSLTGDGLALSKQGKLAYFEAIVKKSTPPALLIPLGDGRFLLEVDGKRPDSSVAAYHIVAFKNPDAEGRMQHLGSGLRLYKRVS